MITASIWSYLGFGAGQVLRLGSAIVMRRLLFPEAFGLMALVNVFLRGLALFSDLGLGPNIVQSRRGEEPVFLRTAWTIWVCQGVVLSIAAAALAWPVARFYGEPQLLALLPAASLALLIGCLTSTKLFVLSRRVEVRALTLLDLGSQVFALTVMIALAFFWRSVWILVIGAVAGAVFRTTASHLVLGPPRMRFEFDRGVAREIIRFGKWLFLSSMLTFMATSLDRPVLAKFMSAADLGVYSTAYMLAQMMVGIVEQLSNQILFPVYARLAEEGHDRLRAQTWRIRAALLCVTLPPIWALIVWGPEIVDLLLPSEWQPAGRLTQILAVGALGAAVLLPIGSVFMAVGDSFRHMLLEATRSASMLLCLLVGGLFGGVDGIIAGVVAASFLYYPVLVLLVRRYRCWFPALDIAAMAVSALAIYAGFWLKGAV
jgi:O-antigen/teichoic acid export membrane protein